MASFEGSWGDDFYKRFTKEMEEKLRREAHSRSSSFKGSYTYGTYSPFEEDTDKSNLQVHVYVTKMPGTPYNTNNMMRRLVVDDSEPTIVVQLTAEFVAANIVVRIRQWKAVMPAHYDYIDEQFKQEIYKQFERPHMVNNIPRRLPPMLMGKPQVVLNDAAIEFFKRIAP